MSGTAPASTVLPGVVDHHVHLGLVDRGLLAGGVLSEVVDCGWDPAPALAWREHPPAGVTVKIAGPFHTAVGGYPADRSWAPDAAVCQLRDAGDAARAVSVAAAERYDALKIALHSGMPLLDDRVLSALIEAAHAHGLRVFVHAEGPGQAMRAVEAGADVLVHAPFSEALTDAELERALRTTWVSTLAIHEPPERELAIDNVRRFRKLGGTVLYGTDMGNGHTPVGPSEAEILALEEAGVTGEALRSAVFSGPENLLGSPLPVPLSGPEIITWLETATRLDLDHDRG